MSVSAAVLYLGGLLTVVVVGLVVWTVVRRVRRVVAEVIDTFERFNPAVERLEASSDVTRREMERIGEGLDRWRDARQSFFRHRGDGPGSEPAG